jgi:hypothetical protein
MCRRLLYRRPTGDNVQAWAADDPAKAAALRCVCWFLRFPIIAPPAREWNHVRSDVILAEDLERLVVRRASLVNEIVSALGRVLPPLGAAPQHGVLHTRISHLEQVSIGELRGRARRRQRVAAGARHAFRFARECVDRPAGSHSRPARRRRWHRAPRSVDGPGARVRGSLERPRLRRRYRGTLRVDQPRIADAEIRDFVDRLARRIASFPASGIAAVKSIVNQTSPISSSVLNECSK